MPPLFTSLVLSRVPLLGKIAQRKFKPMIDVHLNYVEAELTNRTWFAGDEMTAADVMMSYPLEVAVARAGAGEGRPNITAWLTKIQSRPAYLSALKAGGFYAFAPSAPHT